MLTAAAPLAGQHHQGAEGAVSQRIGTVHLANKGNAQAQPHFQRGLALLHNFEYPSARKAFLAAQQADPGFVLAYWGEAMTYNFGLWARQDADKARAALARLGPTPEARAAKARSPREKQWLDTVEALYGAGTKKERDRAYAESMRLLHESDPGDVDARAFRALSLMGLSGGERSIPLYMQAAALLEEALPGNPDHPGLLHYLIHAYDDPAHAPLGERAARRYAVVVPDAGHAQHMVSHIYLALGRWPEVEAANVQAMRVENARAAALNEPPGHCGHYSEWEVYAVLQQGRDAGDLIASCRAEAVQELSGKPDPSVLGSSWSNVLSWSEMAVRQGVETGKWAEPLPLPAGKYEFARFNFAYARLLAAGSDVSKAASALADLKRSRAAIAGAMTKELPDDHQLLPWIDRAVAQGDALVLLAGGQRDQAISALKTAAKAEAALPVPFGPPILHKPSAELLGEQLLAAGRKAEAAEYFREALAAAPNRRLAAQGLAAATR
jgi:tetratricopeptide (TPR) repeat protein